MGYLKERIRHAVQFRTKRGYGVHSPFMFNLILNVIRDREKCFSYPEALEKSGRLNRREKKIFRLLSRLIRYLGLGRVACTGKDAVRLSRYLSAIVPGISVLNDQPECWGEVDFVYIGRKTSGRPGLSGWLNGVTPRCMVVADIYKDPFNARIWRKYREPATVSVDMMWYGLLFFDEKIQKGRYSLTI